MTAFIRKQHMAHRYDPKGVCFVEFPLGYPHKGAGSLAGFARVVGGMAYYTVASDNRTDFTGVAFNGWVPESCIDHYIGGHPGHLIEGFAAMDKAEGCIWMCRSRITALMNFKGTVLVELEPAL